MEVYGIKNCDTVKKALKWLNQNNIVYTFHDFKKEGVALSKLEEWQAKAGIDKLLNRKGTTWRGLSEDEKKSAEQLQGAYSLMQKNTSIIKRPVIENEGVFVLGFDESEYQNTFKT